MKAIGKRLSRLDSKPGLEGATCTRMLLPGGMVSEIVRLDKSSGGREPAAGTVPGVAT